jgi:mRNA interferase MazF
MPSTTLYNRGDVVLVSFPFTDLTATKQRPALILSRFPESAARDDVLVAAITSQIPKNLAPDDF